MMELTLIEEIKCAIQEYDRLYQEKEIIEFLKSYFRGLSTQRITIEGFEIEEAVLVAWNFYYLIISASIKEGVLDSNLLDIVIEGLRDHYVHMMTNEAQSNAVELRNNIRKQYSIHGQAPIMLDKHFTSVLFRTSTLLMMKIYHQFDMQLSSDVAEWLNEHYYGSESCPNKTKSYLVWTV
jgi:hypothetical protein